MEIVKTNYIIILSNNMNSYNIFVFYINSGNSMVYMTNPIQLNMN